MDIWRAAEILQRRKWLIVFSVVITAILAYGATRLIGSRWVATARLMSPQVANAVGGNKDGGGNAEERDGASKKILFETILLSREVVEPAYKKIKEQLPEGAALSKEIEFNMVGPRLYGIQVTTSNPEKSELLANALADSFVKRNSNLNTQEAQKIVDLLKTQLKTIDKRLEKARNRYRSYSNQHRIVASSEVESASAHAEIDTVRAKTNDVQLEKAATAARLNDVEARLRALAPVFLAPRPLLNGPRASALSGELDRVGSKLAALQARYGANYPEVKEAVIARDDLLQRTRAAQKVEDAIAVFEQKTNERAALQKSQAELKQQLAELTARAGALSATIAGARNRAQEARNLSDPYGSLASEVASLAEARSAVVARLNNAQIALDIAQRENPIVLLERVSSLNPAINATSGKTLKLIALSVLCALLGSCALIIGLDSVDRRLKNLGEAEKTLPTRILAAIPQPAATLSYSDLARISSLDPRSLTSEAYRFLGLHLLTAAPPNTRSLMVVSAKAEQGSTTTITNLAITLAQAGNRVVLVDANMRTAELHQVFGIPNGFGFSDLLNDPTNSSFERALLQTDVENLRIVTNGSVAENPWELFRSTNLTPVSRRLREMADYVLYDTPSGVMFTDALNLAPIVDGAILCVRALETPTGVEQRLVDLIRESNVNVLGAVLSDVPVSMVAGYENYQHYYAAPMSQGPIGLDGGRVPMQSVAPLVAAPVTIESPDDEPKISREEM